MDNSPRSGIIAGPDGAFTKWVRMIDQLEPRFLLSGFAPTSLGGLTLKFTGYAAKTGISYERICLSGTDDSFVDRQDPTGSGLAGQYIYRRTGDNEATLKEHIPESQTISLHFTSATGGTADWSDDYGLRPVQHLSFTTYKGPWLYLFYLGLHDGPPGTPEVFGTNQSDDIDIGFDSTHKRIVVTAGGRSDTLKVGQSIYETTLVSIFGEGGDDRIIVDYPGTTFIDGGDGNDHIECRTVRRNAFEIDVDNISGGAGNDVIYASTRFSTVQGNAGNDLLIGTAGRDDLRGGDGRDTLYGMSGIDTLHGDAGNDVIDGGTWTDYIYGGSGQDTIDGGAGADSISADAGDDLVHGNDGNDTISGGTGNDTLYGDAGKDVVYGNVGDDHLILNDGEQDTADGGSGNDTALIDEVDRLFVVAEDKMLAPAT